MAKTTGRLNSGLPQAPPGRRKSELDAFRKNLPIFGMKDDIIRLIANNRVTIIAGETGSGKTTQVHVFSSHGLELKCLDHLAVYTLEMKLFPFLYCIFHQLYLFILWGTIKIFQHYLDDSFFRRLLEWIVYFGKEAGVLFIVAVIKSAECSHTVINYHSGKMNVTGL